MATRSCAPFYCFYNMALTTLQLCAFAHYWGHPSSPLVHPCRFLPQGWPTPHTHRAVDGHRASVSAVSVYVFAFTQGSVCARVCVCVYVCMRTPFRLSRASCMWSCARGCIAMPPTCMHTHTHTHTVKPSPPPPSPLPREPQQLLPFNAVLLHACRVSLRLLPLRVAHTV